MGLNAKTKEQIKLLNKLRDIDEEAFNEFMKTYRKMSTDEKIALLKTIERDAKIDELLDDNN